MESDRLCTCGEEIRNTPDWLEQLAALQEAVARNVVETTPVPVQRSARTQQTAARVFQALQDSGPMTCAEIAEICGISLSGAKKFTAILQDEKRIVRVGINRRKHNAIIFGVPSRAKKPIHSPAADVS